MGVPRIRFRSISKSYPGVRALDGVDLALAPGSVHALVGENGAGKSTLIKVLAGAVQPDSGDIELDGVQVAIRTARAGRSQGIAVVYQEFNLARDMTVAENVFLGCWPQSRWGGVNYPALNAEAGRVLAGLGVSIPVTSPVRGLSVARQQMVEIAKALAQDARVLVLDEPSAVLMPDELRTLFRVVCDARARGISVLYVSHRLSEIFEIADTVSVLRDGRHVSTRPIAEVTRDLLVREMVGRPLTDEFPARVAHCGQLALRVQGLTAKGRFRGVGFDVHAGEVFGLTGLIGSGRTSVAQAIFGEVRPSAGKVQVGSTIGPFRNPRRGLAAGVMLLPEDRKQAGLLLERPLRENITLASRSESARLGFLNLARERDVAARYLAELRIRAVSTEAAAGTLSGGNQQKVLLARCMTRAVRVLLLDEPTRGVDVGGKYEIYQLINRLVAKGVAIVMISSELPEIIGMCDRIGVMHEGRLAGVLDNRSRQVTQEEIMRLAAGTR